MSRSVKELISEANAAVETLTVEQAAPLVGRPDVVVLDVREPEELRRTGRIPGAVHAVRGMLEFYADPDTPYYRSELDRSKHLLVTCASGGRSALAAKTLKDMGFPRVSNLLGGMKAWSESGARVEPVESPA